VAKILWQAKGGITIPHMLLLLALSVLAVLAFQWTIGEPLPPPKDVLGY